MMRFTALLFACISLISAYSVHAEINPFKKAKVYSFGDEPAWYFKEGAVIKSASRRDGGDTLFYHLRVNRDQLRLRLSKNDPSGELENTRGLERMSVNDVLVDGSTLSRFKWCLQNQERPGKKLNASAIVINDACVNPGNGDFIINLDDASRNALKFSRRLEFVVEPYSRPIKLSFSMGNFSEVMERAAGPKPPPVKAVRETPAPPKAVVSKPKPKPKSVVKTCKADPPDDYASVVQSQSYPCGDAAKKTQAEKSVNDQVEAEKQKRQAAAYAVQRKQEKKNKKEEAVKRVETEWEKRQTAMWVARCKKHWAKGNSPCYCEKYLDRAPSGVTNSCGR